ncbi:MAG: alpha/beta hydrolase [Alphaproteobacteria bacterium]
MTLDPDAARLIEMARQANNPPFESLDAAGARSLYRDGRRALAPEPVAVAATRDLSAPGPNGPIPLRLYRPDGPSADAVLPVLVYFHGGGWVIGDIDTHDGVCRHLAARSGFAVVSVDYRMGPEHRFPAAVEDCFAATAWVANQGPGLGIDPARVAVGGDSAGGNLAAVVCLMARDAGGPRIGAQLLFYAATDFAMDTESHRLFADGYLLTHKAMRWFQEQYLGGTGLDADWRASPLRAASLQGLPPAYVLTAGYDPLRDEGEAYARRLVEEGVVVTSRRYPGQVHGFLNMGRIITRSAHALDAAAGWLRVNL